jgi:hypothetical protein
MMKFTERVTTMRILSRTAVVVLMAVFTSCGSGGDGSSTPPGAEPLMTQPGTANGSAATQTIGPNGGTLTSVDGRVEITVPAGAVDEDTSFSITPVTGPAENAVATYYLEPEGVTFELPVTLTFQAPESGETRISIEGMGIAYHDVEGYWPWLDVSRDADAKTLSVEVEHFCEFSMLEGYQLSPVDAEIQVNESIQLQVMSCVAPGDDDLEGLLELLLTGHSYRCRPAGELEVMVTNWSVNDIPGGNDTFGTVTAGSSRNATYKAPKQQPDPKTVMVTAEIGELSQSGKVWVCSLVTIGQEGYHGGFETISTGGPVSWTGFGEATWTPAENGEYAVSGTITPEDTQYDIGGCRCTLDQTTQSFANFGQIRDWTDPPTIYWVIPLTTWSATCRCGEDTVHIPQLLIFDWASGCPGVDLWAELENSYPDRLQGTYTFRSCPPPGLHPGLPAWTVTWNFAEQE